MTKVLLGVTGSVAALKTPELFVELARAGHEVKVVATRAALYFFDPAALGGMPRNRDVLILDEDEWPGQSEGRRWQRGDPVLHIELRRWAELLVIAPLDANTLAKLAVGLCDNCLTCMWRAWDPTKPVVLAPAMNTLMWDHPATSRHILQVAADLGLLAPGLVLDDLIAWINAQNAVLRIVPPVSKRLACDDVGVGAMGSVADVVAMLQTLANGQAPW